MRAAALAVLCLLTAGPALADPTKAEIDAVIAPEIGTTTPGLALLVMRQGKVVFKQGYGLADLEAETPVTPDTVFDLASVSKQMTAEVAMMLVQDGTLDLSAPLEESLPAFTQHAGNRPITADDLIHHISGLADYEAAYEPGFTNAQTLAFANEAEPFAPPGTVWAYSNTGYAILATTLAALEEKSDFGEVLQARIFDPLGMSATHAPGPKPGLAPKLIARGYKFTDGAFLLSEEPSPMTGDGGVVTSLNDLAKYEAAIVNRTLLPDGAFDLIFTNGALDNGKPIEAGEGEGYGFGWWLGVEGGHRTAWHSGAWSGTSIAYFRDLHSGLTVIVLTNVENYDAVSIAFSVAALYAAE